MGFVKDRHDETGRILDKPRLPVVGRIGLGEQLESGGPRNLPYFVFKVYAGGNEEGFILGEVRDILSKYNDSPDKPTVIPIFLPANSLDLIGSSEYKLAGKGGRARCVGDGESIQYKLGPLNVLEISGGEVFADEVVIDRHTFRKGDPVFCPGKSHENRWSHCDQCRFKFDGKFQIAGLAYIWDLATGDQTFYSRFFTILDVMNEHVRQGHARFVTEIPLLLRRYEGQVTRGKEIKEGLQLTPQDMPLLSIEIYGPWLNYVEAPRVFAMEGGVMQLEDTPRHKRLAAPEPPKPEPPKQEQAMPRQEPQEPRPVTLHEDGLPGVPFGKQLLGDWSTKAATRKSIIANAVRLLGMSEESAGRAYEEYRTSVTTLPDLWSCLRQHAKAQMEPQEKVPVEVPPEEPSSEPQINDPPWIDADGVLQDEGQGELF